MYKKIFSVVVALSLYLLICNIIYKIYSENIEPSKANQYNITKEIIPKHSIIDKIIKVEKPIGYLKINKIDLNEEIYSINSSKNNIEQHVTILNYSEEPYKDNSIIFIAAHSGTGPLAYFNNLDKLSVNDTITLIYKNKTYNYQIKDIWETKKTGNISVEKEQLNQLILTTCSPKTNNNQLIINSILEKEY